MLAANVDLVLVTLPADRSNPARAERGLSLAWESGAQPVVVLTKCELAHGDLAKELASRLVGADLLATSAETGAGIDQLAARIGHGQTAVLLGPSGASKSTLSNALLVEQRSRRRPTCQPLPLPGLLPTWQRARMRAHRCGLCR